MAEQIPDVVRAKRFELVDDHGTVRAELGFEEVIFESAGHKSSDTAPSLALMDEVGEVVASIAPDYFDAPELMMRNSTRFSGGEHRVALKVESDEAGLVVQGIHPKLEMQDRNAATRVKVELCGGDEHTEPRITICDNQGRPRLEVALDEVVREEAAEVREGVLRDFEVAFWNEYTPSVRMLDEHGNVVCEFSPAEEGSGC